MGCSLPVHEIVSIDVLLVLHLLVGKEGAGETPPRAACVGEARVAWVGGWAGGWVEGKKKTV